MITVKLQTSGRKQIVGVYNPQRLNIDPLITGLRRSGFAHYEFSSTVKGMLIVLIQQLGYSPDECYEMLNCPTSQVSELYQDMDWLLTTLRREWGTQTIAPDIWIKTFENRLRHSKKQRILISDLDAPNEYHWVKNRGGFLICTLNPDMPLEGRLDRHTFDIILESKHEIPDALVSVEQYFTQ